MESALRSLLFRHEKSGGDLLSTQDFILSVPPTGIIPQTDDRMIKRRMRIRFGLLIGMGLGPHHFRFGRGFD
jgi:hypothetical protein